MEFWTIVLAVFVALRLDILTNNLIGKLYNVLKGYLDKSKGLPPEQYPINFDHAKRQTELLEMIYDQGEYARGRVESWKAEADVSDMNFNDLFRNKLKKKGGE